MGPSDRVMQANQYHHFIGWWQQIRTFTSFFDVYSLSTMKKPLANHAGTFGLYDSAVDAALTTPTLVPWHLGSILHTRLEGRHRSCHIPTNRWQHIHRFRPVSASSNETVAVFTVLQVRLFFFMFTFTNMFLFYFKMKYACGKQKVFSDDLSWIFFFFFWLSRKCTFLSNSTVILRRKVIWHAPFL